MKNKEVFFRPDSRVEAIKYLICLCKEDTITFFNSKDECVSIKFYDNQLDAELKILSWLLERASKRLKYNDIKEFESDKEK